MVKNKKILNFNSDGLCLLVLGDNEQPMQVEDYQAAENKKQKLKEINFKKLDKKGKGRTSEDKTSRKMRKVKQLYIVFIHPKIVFVQNLYLFLSHVWLTLNWKYFFLPQTIPGSNHLRPTLLEMV